VRRACLSSALQFCFFAVRYLPAVGSSTSNPHPTCNPPPTRQPANRRRQDKSVLGRLLADCRRLIHLDLSELPRLTTHVLQSAIMRAEARADLDPSTEGGRQGGGGSQSGGSQSGSSEDEEVEEEDWEEGAKDEAEALGWGRLSTLRRLNLSGCEALQLPFSLVLVCRGLADLDLAGTATDDGDLVLIASSMQRLRRLVVSGCTSVTDAGARALAAAPAVRGGRVRALGVGRLPRVTPGGFEQLLGAWAAGAAAAGVSQSDWTESFAAADSGCSSGSDSDSSSERQPPRRQRRGGEVGGGDGLLWLDASGSGSVDGGVLRAALRAGAAPPRQQQQRGVSSFAGYGGATAEDAAGVAELIAEAGALLETLSTVDPESPTVGGAAPWQRPQQQQLRQLVGLSGLLVAGCGVCGDDLGDLATAGWLRRLDTLDLSHCEPLRKPRPDSARAGVAAAAAAQAAHPLAAVITAGISPSTLRVLRLDGCHVTDAAAAAIASHCGAALAELSLVGCRPLGNAGLRALATDCRQLRALSVGGAGPHWREDAALAGAAALAGLTALRVARRSLLTDAQFSPVLACCGRLRSLQLAGCYSLTDAALAGAPACLTELTLVAMDRSFTGSGLAALRRLRRLRLSACPGVTPAAVQLVLACCLQLAALELPFHMAGATALLPLRGGGGVDANGGAGGGCQAGQQQQARPCVTFEGRGGGRYH
jgi:hypothetical protein